MKVHSIEPYKKLVNGRKGYISRLSGGALKAGYAKFIVDANCYLYDTATNAVVTISSSTYAILEDYLAAGPQSVLRNSARELRAQELHEALNFLEDFRRCGMLRPMRPLNYLAITSACSLRRQYAQGLERMTLGITKHCNQRCRYCPFGAALRDTHRSAMSSEIVRQSIDYLHSHAVAGLRPSLTLFGGEPTVHWPVVKEAIHYIRCDLGREDTEIVLCTNATLLNECRLEFLIAHKIVLQISLDGPAHVHDRNRIFASGGVSHGTVMGVLDRIRARNFNYYVNYVRPHCTFELESDLLEVFRFISQTMFRDLEVSFGYRTGSASASGSDRARHEAQLDELIEQSIHSLVKGYPFQRAFFSAILHEVLGPVAVRRVGRATECHTRIVPVCQARLWCSSAPAAVFIRARASNKGPAKLAVVKAG